MILSSLWEELRGPTSVRELWVRVLLVQKSSSIVSKSVGALRESPLNDSVAVPANLKHESRQKEQLI